MRPSRHIAASSAIAIALYFFTRSVYAGLLCVAAGVLIDSDHVIEYIIHHGWKGVSIRRVYEASVHTEKQKGKYKFTKLYFVFHLIEMVILLWVIAAWTKNIYVLGIALGYTSHIIMDATGNKMYPISYSMFQRARNKFEIDTMIQKKYLINGKS